MTYEEAEQLAGLLMRLDDAKQELLGQFALTQEHRPSPDDKARLVFLAEEWHAAFEDLDVVLDADSE